MFLQAKKSLGQHFLNSKHVLEQIISAAHIENGEVVLEIGPGTGILTEALLQAGAKVVAVEKDVRAIELLKEKFAETVVSGQLKIISGDILDDTLDLGLIENDALDSSAGTTDVASKNGNHNSASNSRANNNANLSNGNNTHISNNSFLVVANIPYYITGAILEKFLEKGPRPNRMVLLVQKEVADRIVTKENKESILSISIKAFGTPKIITKVPRGAFTPPPTVDSAVLAIENISDKLFTQNNVQISRFFTIVKAGFAHKRKFVMSNLEDVISKEKLREIWTKNNWNEKVRAEKMEVERWVEIAKNVTQQKQ